jgi:hypothetical protein
MCPLQAPVALAADSVVEFLQGAGAAIASDNATSAADLAGRAALDTAIATSLAAASHPIAVRQTATAYNCFGGVRLLFMGTASCLVLTSTMLGAADGSP